MVRNRNADGILEKCGGAHGRIYDGSGKMAKVKQISIKALRYYEKIGILKPAYCAPDTGYRYYKNEQMLAIDMIKFLQILDIPLKNWNQYVEPTGEFDLKGLLRDGRSVPMKKSANCRAA